MPYNTQEERNAAKARSRAKSRAKRKARGVCRSCNRPSLSRCSECQLTERLAQHSLSRTLYDVQLNNQGYRCAICDILFSEDNIPCIDHVHNKEGCNHKPSYGCPNCFRSLLCHKHNKALGLLGDDPDEVVRQMERLKRFSRKQV
jgi:hypothetical protein